MPPQDESKPIVYIYILYYIYIFFMIWSSYDLRHRSSSCCVMWYQAMVESNKSWERWTFLVKIWYTWAFGYLNLNAQLPPGSLTLPLKIYHPKRRVVFQPSFFRGYVKLREGRVWRFQGEKDIVVVSRCYSMGVSYLNGGFSPQIIHWIGFSIINHPLWGTIILGNPHTCIYTPVN